MIKRIVVLTALAVALGGCILQSRAPRYGDGEAVLALGASGGLARMSNLQDGNWVREDESVEIKVVGRHYEAATKSASVTLYFIPLGGSWFVLQGSDPANPAVYMLAEVKDNAATVQPLSCSDLKKDQELATFIEHEGDDCFIKPGAAADDLFARLVQKPGEPVSRLELVQ